MYPFLLGIKRAFAYARVSTEHQSGLSIEGQLRVCQQFGEMFGVEVVETFWDKESGSLDEREQFDVMMEKLRGGEADAVLCEKYDRFSRSGASGEVLIQKIEKQLGVKVIAAAELIDTSTPLGKAMRGIKMIFSNMEREEIVARTTKRMRDIATHGFWLGGPPPLGYKVIVSQDSEGRNRKRLEIDEETAPLVRKIFEMYASGKIQTQIIEWLNENGFRTSRGNHFTKSSVSDILKNEKYTGVYTYAIGDRHSKHQMRDDAIKVAGAIPAIIDEETWERVQMRFRVYPGRKHTYLLSGLAVCGICGGYLHGHGGSVPQYRCKNHKPQLSITKQKLETQVFKFIEHEVFEDLDLTDFEIMAQSLSQKAAASDKERQQRIDELQLKKARLETEERRIADAIRSGIALDAIRKDAEQLKKDKDSLEQKINQLESAERRDYVTAEDLQLNWERMKREFLEGDEKKKEEILRQTIQKVQVFHEYVKILPK
ncbi:MAG: recombinase family protein [Thermotogota bacterium]|nr:recombinase family protein [Thermotogota bacterium]